LFAGSNIDIIRVIPVILSLVVMCIGSFALAVCKLKKEMVEYRIIKKITAPTEKKTVVVAAE